MGYPVLYCISITYFWDIFEGFFIVYYIYYISESFFFCSDLGTTPPGPPSASLLRDWLDVSQLDPDDMDVLQKELETGAPDVFSIHDFTDL